MSKLTSDFGSDISFKQFDFKNPSEHSFEKLSKNLFEQNSLKKEHFLVPKYP